MNMLLNELSPTKLLLLFTLAITGCNSGEGSWPSSPDDETSNDSTSDTTDDSASTDTNYSEQNTTAGVLVSSGNFALSTLVTANTSNDDGSGSIRQMKLTWEQGFSDADSITYTVCQSDENETDECSVLGTVTDSLNYTLELSSLLDAANQSYFVIANDGSSTLTSSVKSIHPGELGKMAGYFKASNAEQGDNFGYNVVISGDGKTIISTAPFEDSASPGVDGSQTDDTTASSASGAAYVFTYNSQSSTWSQTAYLKTTNPERSDYFGYGNSLAISEDGQTVAIGAYGEDSSISGDPTDNSALYAGAVYIFSYDGAVWSQTAYIQKSSPTANDRFGYSLSLNDEGTRLAVGANYESSDSDVENTGAAYIFDYDGSDWNQTTKLAPSNLGEGDKFATTLDLSGDGATLAVGVYFEDSSATGVDGDETNNDAEDSGAVYVFAYDGSNWSQSAYIKASNAEEGDQFGSAVSLNQDGTTLAVGAAYEASSTTGIDGDQSDNDGKGSGAVYLFTYSGNAWTQQAYIKGANTDGATYGYNSDSALDQTAEYWGDHFGNSVKLNQNGTILAVGSKDEDSAAIGINWDAEDDTAADSGAAYVFSYNSSTSKWSQTAYVKASNSEESDWFGRSLDLNNDGDVLVVGAYNEDSGVTGINGDDSDNDADSSGAVYVY